MYLHQDYGRDAGQAFTYSLPTYLPTYLSNTPPPYPCPNPNPNQVKTGHEYSVPNMRSRWFGWGTPVTYEFESVNDCIDQVNM